MAAVEVNFKQELLGVDGKALVGADGAPHILATIVANSLVGGDKPSTSGEDAVRRLRLAERIIESTGPISLSVEEAALVKSSIKDTASILVVARVWDAIEGVAK